MGAKAENNKKKFKKTKFLVVFAIAFFSSVWIFGNLGLAPEEIAKATESRDADLAGLSDFDSLKNKSGENTAHTSSVAVPVKIVIDKIGVDASVVNPENRNATALDESLKNGVVRYPDSGLLGRERNMFLFGHASSLPTVRNQMYKVFSKIRDLNLGDDIKVYSENRVYFYEIVNMALVDKEEALVEFDSDKHKLTLSTCNTFGEKSERFVVEANFVESFPLD